MREDEISVIYGDQGKEMTKKLLKKSQFINEFDNKNISVGIKPNLVVAKPSNKGATTDPAITAGIIEYLQERKVNNIKILESSWVGDNTKRAFKKCGYQQLSQQYGVELINLEKCSTQIKNIEGEEITVFKSVFEVDYLINVPVLKAHCQTKITCALKNMKGCIPDSEKRKFHSKGLHRPIALLNKIIKPDITIVDGIYGDLTFEEGGNPVKMNRILIGKDPVLMDTYITELMGYNIQQIDYIKYAEKYGIGSTNLNQDKIIKINRPSKSTNNPRSSKVEKLGKYINQKSACSACYSNLIRALYQLDNSSENILYKLEDKIYIGQSHQAQKKNKIGIGKCTNQFKHSLTGCPPTTKSILKFLKRKI